MISEEIDSGRPRIKMYYDDDGQFKGEALVVYFRPESVNIAIQMADETEFRLGEPGSLGPMRVQAADFSFKSQQDAPVKSNMRDKKKIIERTQKLNRCVPLSMELGLADLCFYSKLADWDDDDISHLPDTGTRMGRVVILKHMFTLKELEVSVHAS